MTAIRQRAPSGRTPRPSRTTATALPPQTEKQFQAAVVQFAKLTGWLVYHTHDSRRSEPGFPDLVLVRDDRIIYAELKTERGRMSAAQRTWQEALICAGAEHRVWRPSHWPIIESTLR